MERSDRLNRVRWIIQIQIRASVSKDINLSLCNANGCAVVDVCFGQPFYLFVFIFIKNLRMILRNFKDRFFQFFNFSFFQFCDIFNINFLYLNCLFEIEIEVGQRFATDTKISSNYTQSNKQIKNISTVCKRNIVLYGGELK